MSLRKQDPFLFSLIVACSVIVFLIFELISAGIAIAAAISDGWRVVILILAAIAAIFVTFVTGWKMCDSCKPHPKDQSPTHLEVMQRTQRKPLDVTA